MLTTTTKLLLFILLLSKNLKNVRWSLVHTKIEGKKIADQLAKQGIALHCSDDISSQPFQ